ncbi:MAG: protease complex subunit PrcB family protein [Candidatus Bathyarchaeia archaeon]
MKDKSYIVLFFFTILLVFSLCGLENVCSALEREIEFGILEKGDISGYCEEAYFVVENEADWVRVWERHTLIFEPREPPPSIDFSRNIVVCAFMGQCPTTGYSIDVERIWTDGKQVFVEVVKRGLPESFAVGQMITCPYVMILVEKTGMPFVFNIINEDVPKYVLTEFFSLALWITLLAAFVVVLVLKAQNCK